MCRCLSCLTRNFLNNGGTWTPLFLLSKNVLSQCLKIVGCHAQTHRPLVINGVGNFIWCNSRYLSDISRCLSSIGYIHSNYMLLGWCASFGFPWIDCKKWWSEIEAAKFKIHLLSSLRLLPLFPRDLLLTKNVLFPFRWVILGIITKSLNKPCLVFKSRVGVVSFVSL